MLKTVSYTHLDVYKRQVIVSAYTQNVWLGLLAGVVAGIGIGLFLSLIHI